MSQCLAHVCLRHSQLDSSLLEVLRKSLEFSWICICNSSLERGDCIGWKNNLWRGLREDSGQLDWELQRLRPRMEGPLDTGGRLEELRSSAWPSPAAERSYARDSAQKRSTRASTGRSPADTLNGLRYFGYECRLTSAVLGKL